MTWSWVVHEGVDVFIDFPRIAKLQEAGERMSRSRLSCRHYCSANSQGLRIERDVKKRDDMCVCVCERERERKMETTDVMERATGRQEKQRNRDGDGNTETKRYRKEIGDVEMERKEKGERGGIES